MLSSHTPVTSPLARFGTHSSHPQILLASPSSQTDSSPINALQERRRRDYKPQGPSRSSILLPGELGDTPQKRSLSDRLKVRVLDRIKQRRARQINIRRSIDGSSNDGFDMSDDSIMTEGEDLGLDDELYRRVIMNEERKANHSKRVSFERDFGSSIDPDMYENMETLEEELTGKVSRYKPPSPPAEHDDDLIQEYLDELEEFEWQDQLKWVELTTTGAIDTEKEDPVELEREFTRENDEQQPSPSRSIFSDYEMSSPPSSPCHSTDIDKKFPMLSPKSPSVWLCPFCSVHIARTAIACVNCMTRYSLEHAQSTWIDPITHPKHLHGDHVPLTSEIPSIGMIMLCRAPGCDWCFAL